MSGLITKMVTFGVLMVIGYVFARRDASDGSFTKAASSLVINVFMSATIINSVLATGQDLGGGKIAEVLLVMCVTLGLSYLIAAVIARLLPIEKEHRAGFELLMAVPNNMFIALPVVEELFGPAAVFYCGLSNIPFNLLLYTYGIWRLQKGEGDGKFPIKEILGSAPLLATLVGLILFVTKLPVPQPVKDLVSTMAGATMPLSMIVIGASLSTVSLLDAFKNGRFYFTSFVKLIVSPIIVWFACGLLTDDLVLRATGAIIAASSSGIIVTVLTIKHNGDAIFTSEGILQSTVLAMLTIPMLVYFLL